MDAEIVKCLQASNIASAIDVETCEALLKKKMLIKAQQFRFHLDSWMRFKSIRYFMYCKYVFVCSMTITELRRTKLIPYKIKQKRSAKGVSQKTASFHAVSTEFFPSQVKYHSPLTQGQITKVHLEGCFKTHMKRPREIGPACRRRPKGRIMAQGVETRCDFVWTECL